MTEHDFLNLLARRESESLDFKRDPYRIVDASDADKAKFIKDILAFANAWRDGPAHILLGVAESGGNGPEIAGIPSDDPIDDATLQQLVNSKLNHPIAFSYERITVQGRSVAVIEVGHPIDRPVFLRKSYGGLIADAVYIRRGSSTDIAKPDEVARMGHAESRSRSPKVFLEFAGFADGRRIGPKAVLRVRRLGLPEPGSPERTAVDQRIREEQLPGSIWGVPRKKIADEFATMQERLARGSLAFVVRNEGPVPAKDLEIHLRLPRTDAFSVTDVRPLPFKEARGGSTAPVSMLDLTHFPTASQVTIRCPKLHAGQAKLIRYGILVRATAAAEYPIRAQIAADELATPQFCDLLLSVACETRYFVYNP